ncbi:MAG: hypothetical protein KF749_02940 [Bacteroidetes bacterium]|nr:hypothetical protein [Bacteroidota bacterium]MCW5896772.1 hypothetical protein [Bacteroidota bacterium]
MATPRLGSFLDGLSGRMGNVVFYESYGKAGMRRKPKRNAPFTEKQVTQQARVRLAGRYVKLVAADPEARAPYDEAAKLRNRPVAGLISGDYLNAPEVNSIDLSQYNREPGGTIIIGATDDFEVTSVKVRINDANGNEVESGNAVKEGGLLDRWVYTATAQVPAGQAYSVVVTANDRPGNIGTKTETVQ